VKQKPSSLVDIHHHLSTFVENLVVFNYAALDFADDTAAAAGGVVLGQVYHNLGALRIRIT
jgi:hypothetical protein